MTRTGDVEQRAPVGRTSNAYHARALLAFLLAIVGCGRSPLSDDGDVDAGGGLDDAFVSGADGTRSGDAGDAGPLPNGDASDGTITDGEGSDGDAKGDDGAGDAADAPADAPAPPCTDASDLSADPKNCGACGHDCQGSWCAGGLCQPIALASNANGTGIAVDSTRVYWTTQGSPQQQKVMSCATSGCAVPTVLASNQASPGAIAVDATNVYWVDNDGGVRKCAVGGCGGVPTVLATSANNEVIAIDATNVYWANYTGDISTCAISGCGAPTVLASAQEVQSLTVDATSIYWTVSNTPSGGEVMKCAKGGCGGSPTVLASGLGGQSHIAVDATNVYWTDSAGYVMAIPLVGGPPTTLASAVPYPWVIAVDATNVYWINWDMYGKVERCAVGGCNHSPTVLAITTTAAAIAVDATSLYWIGIGPAAQVVKLVK